MKSNCRLIATLALLIVVHAAHGQQATYTFESPVFETFSGNYPPDRSLAGTLTLSEWVPPNTTMDVTPILVGYSFSDGTVSLDETNAESIAAAGIRLTTDAFGKIQSYGMIFWKSPRATTVGEVFEGMTIAFAAGAGSPGCVVIPFFCRPASVSIASGEYRCVSISDGQCDGAVLDEPDGNWGATRRVSDQFGFDLDFFESTWTGRPPPPSVPAMGATSLLVLSLLLAALGATALRPRLAN